MGITFDANLRVCILVFGTYIISFLRGSNFRKRPPRSVACEISETQRSK